MPAPLKNSTLPLETWFEKRSVIESLVSMPDNFIVIPYSSTRYKNLAGGLSVIIHENWGDGQHSPFCTLAFIDRFQVFMY
jgi:hypothetical protein